MIIQHPGKIETRAFYTSTKVKIVSWFDGSNPLCAIEAYDRIKTKLGKLRPTRSSAGEHDGHKRTFFPNLAHQHADSNPAANNLSQRVGTILEAVVSQPGSYWMKNVATCEPLGPGTASFSHPVCLLGICSQAAIGSPSAEKAHLREESKKPMPVGALGSS